MGKGVAGKSSLTYRFINYNAPSEHEATIEDRYKTQTKVDDKIYEVEILDTAGEEDFQNMADNWINFGEGFLLVFAINDRERFDLLDKKRARILKIKENKPCPIVICGNKLDLNNDRKVSFPEAKKKADDWGCEYIETSAQVIFY
ncbi:MAG: GTP-binding protein [archaeon]|nr:GTP-binding protein [archaeon]